MKKLKRMLLIHWHYFSHEMIEFGDINFLTGKNSSGKSTIIDAMQLVLLGDTTGTSFNKAASGKGARTLTSYLRGELGDDEESGYRYLRDGRFTSYIALEFHDDVKKKYFTSGCCFDTFGENDCQRLFFRIDDTLPENEFIKQDVPLSIEDLRAFIRSNYAEGRSYTTNVNRDFREDLCGKLGGLQVKRFSDLLRKAAALKLEDTNIQQFITEFVCGEEQKINVTDMQENIRNYDILKKEASILKERIDLLSKIITSHDEFTRHKENETLYSYLIDRSGWEIKESEITKARQKVEQYLNELAVLNEELAKAEIEQEQLQSERDNLKLQLDSSENARRLDELYRQIEEKLRRRDELKNEYERYKALLHRTISSWVSCISDINKKISETDLSIIDSVLSSRIEDIRAAGTTLCESAELFQNSCLNGSAVTNQEQLAIISVEADRYRDSCKILSDRLVDAQSQIAGKQVLLKREKESLEKGIYQFPPDAVDLKEAIQSRLLSRFGQEAGAVIVAEAAEIISERWRNVIEGYLNTQKFHIAVAPEHFTTAFQLYESIKRQKTVFNTGLVDSEKIMSSDPVLDKGSLAEELETENPVVRFFFDHVLGHLQKCDSIRDLRRHTAAITDDGALYQNFAIRTIDPTLWESPAIGQGGARLRLEAVNIELQKLSQELLVYAALITVLQGTGRFSHLSANDIENIIGAINDYHELPSLEQTIERLRIDAESIDKSEIETLRNRLTERERDISNIGLKIRKFAGDKATATEKLRVCNEETLPRLQAESNALRENLESAYDKDWISETGGTRYDRELSTRGNAEEINKAFPREQSRSRNSKDEAWSETRDLRRKYNDVYKMGFDINDTDNAIYIQYWHEFSEIKLPEYEAKIEDTRIKAFQQFQEDFLSKLQSNIFNARRQIDDLNTAIKGANFGEDTYRFRIMAKPDYKRFYDMIVDEMLLTGGYNLLSDQFNSKYKDEITDLFAIITNDSGGKISSGYEDYEKRVQIFTDYKTYLDFDLEVIKPGGETERLSKTIGKKSGGETQTPFYIAVLASFVQLYRVGHDKNSNTARLILFDEAFSKMDGERIIQSIELLKKFNFQAVLAAPPEKVPDIATLVDKNLCVLRDGRKICVKPFEPRDLEILANEPQL